MSVWNRERVPGITGRHALGLWLTYRKLASAGYVPGEVSRSFLKLKVPAWYPVNFSLAARLNAEDRIITSTDFWLTCLIGTSSLAAGFRLQMYDSAVSLRLGDPLNFANCLGSAQRPFFLRKPYKFTCRSPVLIRVQNQDTSGATNLIQVVAFGYGD
jgi:hypothetical protein